MAIAEGGGILVSSGAKVTIGPGTVIERNYAVWRGGGIAVIGGTLMLSDGIFNLSGGIISGNKAKRKDSSDFLAEPKFHLHQGGAVCIKGDSFNMAGGDITNNKAKSGGRLVIHFSDKAIISGGRIKNNKAKIGFDIFIFEESSIASKDGFVKKSIFFIQPGNGIKAV
jgi:hypothetical protein